MSAPQLYLPTFKAFRIVPATAFGYTFQYYQGTPTTAATVDLTGASGSLTITDPQENTLLTLSSTATSPATGIYFGGTESTPSNGIISLVIDLADVEAITWRYANYTMSLTTSIFGLQKLLYGTFSVDGFLP